MTTAQWAYWSFIFASIAITSVSLVVGILAIRELCLGRPSSDRHRVSYQIGVILAILAIVSAVILVPIFGLGAYRALRISPEQFVLEFRATQKNH